MERASAAIHLELAKRLEPSQLRSVVRRAAHEMEERHRANPEPALFEPVDEIADALAALRHHHEERRADWAALRDAMRGQHATPDDTATAPAAAAGAFVGGARAPPAAEPGPACEAAPHPESETATAEEALIKKKKKKKRGTERKPGSCRRCRRCCRQRLVRSVPPRATTRRRIRCGGGLGRTVRTLWHGWSSRRLLRRPLMRRRASCRPMPPTVRRHHRPLRRHRPINQPPRR